MKKINKKLFVVSLLCLSVFALFGCSDEPSTTNQESGINETTIIHEYDDIAATPETFDDYLTATEIINNAVTYLETDLANNLDQINTDNAEEVAATVETVKKPFTQFMAMTAPAEYETANAHFVKACELSVKYIDAVAAGQDASADLKAAQDEVAAGITATADVIVNK